jgi:peptide/nickel transport system substrate-binding protein
MNANHLEDFFGLKPEGPEQKPRETLRDSLGKKPGFISRLRLLPKVLSFNERYAIFGLLLVIIGSIIATPITAYYHYTAAQPAFGGKIIEGVLGEPRLINPLLSQSNDADRDLASLIYSGLLKYNEEGKLMPDLAKSYDISSDGLNYTVYLNENATWHDNGTNGIEHKVTADDVIFTVRAAQNPDYASPQRVSWQGVEIEKVNDYAVIFKLKNKYAQFLNNLTMGILPQHIWQDVKPINFALSDYNLKPIGSGYYMFDKLKKNKLGRIASYELVAYKNHFAQQPFIERLDLHFFDSEDEMIEAYNRNEIEDLGVVSAQNLSKLKFRKRLDLHEVKLPRYFGVFFNQNQSRILANKNVRLALSHATDRTALIHAILSDHGVVVNSPMIGGILDINSDVKAYAFDLTKAKDILAADGWGNPDENGILTKGKDKDITKLSIKITTSTWPELVQVATMLKEQWKAAGVDVQIESLPIAQLQQAIKERNYQSLLFGEILNIDPDPFSLWHSSQKREPGLNLALYDNKTADTLLEEARQTLNPLERMKKYDDFQRLVIEDIPSIFLYSPYYLYGQAKRVHGFNTAIISMPSDRFANVENWYINTSRAWK